MLKLESGMVAIETLFGWTLGGRVPVAATNLAVSLTSTMMNTYTDITHLWSLEAIGIKDPIEVKSKEEEEQQALKQFRENVARDEDGRYVVSLPWKESANLNLPSNRSVAEKRLQRATNQLLKQQQFTSYNEVFRGWENEGLIVTISEENGKEQDRGHYLPHRPVFKESTTTPVRPVFDASCKIGKFPSLNDCLYKGPNLLEIIPALLLRFREHAIGVSADIRKAFQMLRVREEDQVFQRFLWWTDSTCSKMKIYQHQRVVFGMNCSPFLLAATINQHLESISNNNMVSSLTDSFYVDNLVTSLPTVCDYEQLKVEATSAMNMAGMELRQWARTFVDEDKADTSTEKDECLSILGLHWNTKFDSLACAIPDVDHHDKYTKKNILSMVARIFDPIGFLSPALVPLKRIIQDSWVQELGWDDTLPEDSQNKARNWIKGMKILNLIKIPRQFQFSHSSDTEIHVFVDASSTAYAAVVYCRSVVNGKVKVQLLLAKSRLSPPKRNKMKTMEATTNPTIPRLELMACVVGTRLATTVRKALKWENVPYHFWTDSTTALAWIRRHDHWGAFVGNRVAEILKTTEYNQWRHVPGDLNPADLPSRGCSPEELLKSRWWEGPTWLKDDRSTWPHSEEPINEEAVSIEKRKTAVLVAATVKCAPRFSSYRKNVAVWGWILRFINQCRKRKYPSVVFTHHYLSIGEIRAAEKILIKTIQEVFPKNSSRIGGMQVCCDADGILKVQTRLTYRDDKSDFIQPILLPKDHPLVDLLIMDIHKLNGHAGVQIIMSKSREKYWIIQTRRTIKRIIRSCAVCRRYQSKPLNVVPSALPRGRVETSEPFQTTGVDLFGPMFLKNGTKTWVVIFTCAYFRCVHLETVTSLSTEAFLGSLERFISIYGRPNTVYSDNGTNFHGAVNIFNSLDWKKIEEESNVRQIQWIFNPPSAAWWGGFWERLIRSIKDLLKRILGTAKLNYDELRTCIAGVCATINNRPLTVVTEDNGDLIPLTPAIFLRRPVNATMPEATDSSSLQRGYLRMKGLQQQLQERFRKEYLSFLVQRCPSQPKRNEIQEGAVVLVGDERKKRFQWPLGIIVELYAGRDGAKRVAKVKTANGYLTRPLQRLYPLEINCQDAETLKTHPAKVKAGSEKSTAGAEIPNQRVIISKHGRIIKSPARYGQWPT
ncbi:unnamed protein product [Orchesella dallaii]|uniref:Integrase catalytic domain-containing protein n=1 Tax=Orchesella dallaii TaxID=48710 RepID=A0ABP1Q5I6_9HEXA